MACHDSSRFTSARPRDSHWKATDVQAGQGRRKARHGVFSNWELGDKDFNSLNMLRYD